MDDTTGRVDIDVERTRAGGTAQNERDAAAGSGRREEATRAYASDELPADVEQRAQQLREEIHDTRDEMTETIDAIQERLNPRNIMADATERVKTATTERVRDMADTASETAHQAMDYTRDTANRAVGTARQHPIPLALIGIGAAWLLTNRTRRSSSYGQSYGRGYERDYGHQYDSGYGWTRDRDLYDDGDNGIMARVRNNPVPAALAGVGLTWLAFSRGEHDGESGIYGYESGYGRNREYAERWRGASGAGTSAGMSDRTNESATDESSVAQMASRTKEYAAETADSMRRMARRRQGQLERMIRQNPLLVGAGALMLGAAFGLAVPETDMENEWMGEARDSMVDRAKGMARDTVNQVQEAAGSVVETAKKATGMQE